MSKDQEVITIYSRKSHFADKGKNIGNSVELRRGCIHVGFDDACADRAVVYEEKNVSGNNLSRPDFKRMMQAS